MLEELPPEERAVEDLTLPRLDDRLRLLLGRDQHLLQGGDHVRLLGRSRRRVRRRPEVCEDGWHERRGWPRWRSDLLVAGLLRGIALVLRLLRDLLGLRVRRFRRGLRAKLLGRDGGGRRDDRRLGLRRRPGGRQLQIRQPALQRRDDLLRRLGGRVDLDRVRDPRRRDPRRPIGGRHGRPCGRAASLRGSDERPEHALRRALEPGLGEATRGPVDRVRELGGGRHRRRLVERPEERVRRFPGLGLDSRGGRERRRGEGLVRRRLGLVLRPFLRGGRSLGRRRSRSEGRRGGGGRARRPLHPRLDPKRSRRQRQRRRIEGTEERVLRLDVGEDPARRKVAVPGGHATGERSPSRRRRTCGDDERRHDDDRLRRPRLVLASRLPRRNPLRREEHGYGPGSAGPRSS